MLSGGDPLAPSGAPVASGPGPSATPVAEQAPAALTGTRTVRARGGVVTIVEEVTVSSGEGVSVAPARRSTDPALQLTGVQVLAEDGTATTFVDPVSLGAERTLRVRGSYRLRSCPDLLPVTWPSPMTVTGDPGWSRTWTRTSEPLRTGQTLCPKARATAGALAGLSARLVAGKPPGNPPEVRLRLRWQGATRLVVQRVGSLGGLAAESPPAPSGAEGASGFVLVVPPGSSRPLRVQPVESCPNARPRSDRLTLLAWTDARGKPARLVAVGVPGLGRWLDRQVCR